MQSDQGMYADCSYRSSILRYLCRRSATPLRPHIIDHRKKEHRNQWAERVIQEREKEKENKRREREESKKKKNKTKRERIERDGVIEQVIHNNEQVEYS